MSPPLDLEPELRRAYQLFFTGQTEAAQMAFETLQRHYPNCPDIWNGLGLIAEEKTDLSAALDLYQHALQHAPDEPEYHNNLALLRQKRQEPRLALWHFQKVWELQPGPHSRWNLIQALLSTPSLSHSLDLCQQLLWQDPTDFKLHQLLRTGAQPTSRSAQLVSAAFPQTSPLGDHQLLSRLLA